jgi:hypothetical protein
MVKTTFVPDVKPNSKMQDQRGDGDGVAYFTSI